ncbi:hypothetical protein [Haloferax gibbonsii]|uniref:hypothetical protein n=1 Tax=Haloferax gibbonsii TaxID=35746 RepID=UPI003CCDCDD7
MVSLDWNDRQGVAYHGECWIKSEPHYVCADEMSIHETVRAGLYEVWSYWCNAVCGRRQHHGRRPATPVMRSMSPTQTTYPLQPADGGQLTPSSSSTSVECVPFALHSLATITNTHSARTGSALSRLPENPW